MIYTSTLYERKQNLRYRTQQTLKERMIKECRGNPDMIKAQHLIKKLAK